MDLSWNRVAWTAPWRLPRGAHLAGRPDGNFNFVSKAQAPFILLDQSSQGPESEVFLPCPIELSSGLRHRVRLCARWRASSSSTQRAASTSSWWRPRFGGLRHCSFERFTTCSTLPRERPGRTLRTGTHWAGYYRSIALSVGQNGGAGSLRATGR